MVTVIIEISLLTLSLNSVYNTGLMHTSRNLI